MTFHESYSYEDVSKAVNAGADLVGAEINGEYEGRDYDTINLVVNAAMFCLKTPGGTFDEMAEAHYSTPADEIREWWPEWSD